MKRVIWSILRCINLCIIMYYADLLDPEEFLNLLFKHVLNIEAFLQIK